MDAFRGLDDTAERLADEYPQHFAGHGDPQQRLFDLLLAGNPAPKSVDEAREQALSILVERSQAELAAVPFRRRYAASGASGHDLPRFYAPRTGLVFRGRVYAAGERLPAGEVAGLSREERERLGRVAIVGPE